MRQTGKQTDRQYDGHIDRRTEDGQVERQRVDGPVHRCRAASVASTRCHCVAHGAVNVTHP